MAQPKRKQSKQEAANVVVQFNLNYRISLKIRKMALCIAHIANQLMAHTEV